MSDSDQPATPTTYDMQEGFDYHGFRFSDDFPIPMAYVVAYGMAHFRGPDTYLWFAPDRGFGVRDIDWNYPQNVAEFDRRQEDGDDAYHADPEYQETVADLCRALDALIASDHRYDQWSKTPRKRPRTATRCETCGQ
jgi:hypothetical protein